jgi:hypothetical protein
MNIDDERGANDNGVDDVEAIPDAADGLTKKERIVLRALAEAQKERDGRRVPMVMLYGRVVEKIDMSPQELMDIVKRLTGEDPRRT